MIFPAFSQSLFVSIICAHCAEWWGAGVVICLERGLAYGPADATATHCFSKIQIGFTFLVPAHLGSPGKRAVKRVCVCVFVPTEAMDNRRLNINRWH